MTGERPVALVTGATSTSSLGGSVALRLAERGYDVACTYRSNPEGSGRLIEACKELGASAIAVRADVAEDRDCEATIEQVVGRFSRLDALVNNAAVTRPVPHRDLHELDAGDFHDTFSVNLIGPYQMARAAWGPLRVAGDAAIVNVSSIGSVTGKASSIAYATSKGALNTLTLSLARVFAPEVRVNAVIPGGMLGPWTRKIMTDEEYEVRLRDAADTYPLGRAVMPSDVAATVCWLIADAPMMTGELIRLDAGRHLL